MPKMMLGYIEKYDLKLNPQLEFPFKFNEFPFNIRINSKGKKIYSKGFYGSMDYDEVESDTNMLRNSPNMMLIKTPVILDDDLKKRMTDWVEWANHAEQSDYDPFAPKPPKGE